MATVNDLWAGYSGLGTPAPVLTDGVLSVTNNITGANVTYRTTIPVPGGVTGTLSFFARAISGAGQAYAAFPTVSTLAGQMVIDTPELTRYEMPINVPATLDLGDLNVGFGFRNSQVGQIEVRTPVLTLSGRLDGDTPPSALANGAHALALTSAGYVVAGSPVSISDGSLARRLQMHGGDGGGPSGLHLGRWDGTSLGVVLATTKSRGAVGEHATVQDGDTIAAYQIRASDGETFQLSSQWIYGVGGPVSSGIVPGEVTLSVALTDGTARNLFGANALGNVRLGTNASLPANTTQGFLYIPSCNGEPSGVPSEAISNMRAMIWDRVGKHLYVYDGGWNMV
jgi:hypothetical protein